MIRGKAFIPVTTHQGGKVHAYRRNRLVCKYTHITYLDFCTIQRGKTVTCGSCRRTLGREYGEAVGCGWSSKYTWHLLVDGVPYTLKIEKHEHLSTGHFILIEYHPEGSLVPTLRNYKTWDELIGMLIDGEAYHD